MPKARRLVWMGGLAVLLTGCTTLWGSGHNRAQLLLTPLLPDYSFLHPAAICSSGYGDDGIDASNSRYTVAETIDRPSDLGTRINAVATHEGYPLGVDQDRVMAAAAIYPYDPTATYLASPQPWTPFPPAHPYGEQLHVVIHTEPGALVDCGNRSHNVSITTNQAILELTMTAELP